MTAVPTFDYELAETLDQALAALAEGAAPIHGGTELLPAMGLGLLSPTRVISIRALDELRKCERDDDTLILGAGLSHQEIATSALVREGAPLLAEVTSDVGNIRVRCTGTLGGNLAFAEPRSDVATALIALDASVVLQSTGGTRQIPVQDFMVGFYETDLKGGELITAVHVPFRPATPAAYRKIVLSERPVVGVGLAQRDSGQWRLVIGAVGMGTITIDVETLDDLDAGAIAEDIETMADLSGGEDYKRHLAKVTIERCRRAVASTER